MFTPDLSVHAVAPATAPPVQSTRPPPEPRAVEALAQARLRQRSTSTTLTPMPTELERLSASARQFADTLDATGNVDVAVAVSGFRVGQLDLYV